MTETAREFTVELGEEFIPGQRAATINFDGVPLFSEIVFDNRERPAERNIVQLFAHRLRQLLEVE